MSDDSSQQAIEVEVEILGETYKLRTEMAPDYMQRVAQHVDRTAREIREDGGLKDQRTVAILTALAVADQLFRMRDGVEVVRGLSEKRAERLTGEVLSVVEKAVGD